MLPSLMGFTTTSLQSFWKVRKQLGFFRLFFTEREGWWKRGRAQHASSGRASCKNEQCDFHKDECRSKERRKGWRRREKEGVKEGGERERKVERRSYEREKDRATCCYVTTKWRIPSVTSHRRTPSRGPGRQPSSALTFQCRIPSLTQPVAWSGGRGGRGA